MTIVYRLGSDGAQMPLVQANVMPGDYMDLTGLSPQLGLCLACFIAGFVLVTLIARNAPDTSQLHVH
jgi:putative membrane protein